MQKPRIIVYIYEPKGPRLRARAVSISGSSVVASEELALILRSSILARREGGELEMAGVVLPSAAVTPRPGSAPISAADTNSAQRRSTDEAPSEGLRFGLLAGFAYDHVMSAGAAMLVSACAHLISPSITGNALRCRGHDPGRSGYVEGEKRHNVYQAYDADASSRATLRIGELTFDEEGWPVTAGP